MTQLVNTIFYDQSTENCSYLLKISETGIKVKCLADGPNEIRQIQVPKFGNISTLCQNHYLSGRLKNKNPTQNREKRHLERNLRLKTAK